MVEFILLSLFVVNIITPIITYLVHSRCTKIVTPCCSCDRSLTKEEAETDSTL